MYRSFDEEVLLSPESVVAGVVAAATFDDVPELPDLAPFERAWSRATVGPHGDATECDPHVDEAGSIGVDAHSIDAWARHARAANGFGG